MIRKSIIALVLCAFEARATVTAGNAQDGVRTGLAGAVANNVASRYSYTYPLGDAKTLQLNDFMAGLLTDINSEKWSMTAQLEPGTLTCATGAYTRWNGSAWECSIPAGSGGAGLAGVGSCGANQFETADGSGGPTCAQPAFSNLSGTATDGQLANAYSGVGACGSHQWASTLTRNSSPTCTQPAFGDISGTCTLAQGCTAVTSATDDNVLVGSGSAWVSTALPSCSAGSSALTYNVSTNAFGCNTISSTVTTDLPILGDGSGGNHIRLGAVTATAAATYTILSTDRIVKATASTTTNQAFTLPAASGGLQEVTVVDAGGGAGSTRLVTVAVTGTDTIAGFAQGGTPNARVFLTDDNGNISFKADNSSDWLIVNTPVTAWDWDPRADVVPCLTWLDSNRGVTSAYNVANAREIVTLWTDIVTGGNYAPAAGTTPTMQYAGVGKRFINEIPNTGGFESPANVTNNSGAFTVLTVFTITTNAGPYGYFAHNLAAGTGGGLRISTGIVSALYGAGNTTAKANWVQSAGAQELNGVNQHLAAVSARYAAANSGVWVNNRSEVIAAATNGVFANTTAKVCVGSEAVGGTNAFKGLLGKFVLFGGSISETNRARYDAQSMKVWGL